MTFAVVYEVGQAALAELMHDRPSIADEIAVTLSQRAKAGTSGAASEHGVVDATAPDLLLEDGDEIVHRNAVGRNDL